MGFFYKHSRVLAIISSIILAGSIALAAIAWSKPTTIEQKIPLLNYYQDSRFNYLVTLTPSNIFAEDDARSVTSYNYPKNITESLDITFKHSPSSDKPAQYSIMLVMENPSVWEKRYEILPPINQQWDFTTSFNLDMNTYDAEFSLFEEALGISGGRFLRVLVSATIDQQTFNFSLPIEIGKDTIKIDTGLIQRKLCGRGAFSYKVNLKPNPVFAESSLSSPEIQETTGNVVEPGEVIFTRMADTMDINYEYRYSDNATDSQVATLTRLSLELTAGKLWSHEIPLMEITGDNSTSINFNLDLAYFIDLMGNIRSETGVPADSYTMVLKAETLLNANTNHGDISENYVHTLSGSIASGILTWDSTLSNQKPGAITQTKMIPNPAKVMGISATSARWVFLVLAILTLACLGCFVFFYYQRRPSRTLDSIVTAYHKKYGDRIVDAVSEFPIIENMVVSLGTIEELAAVSDELAKPIVYVNPLGNGLPHTFYVLDGATRYQFLLQ
ncbi:MAG: DUF5305 family protein [Dehalococcoidales bacterium]